MTTAGAERAALKLLVDACLSPAVVIHLATLFGARIDAVHIDRIARPGLSDEAVLDLAQRDHRAVVTANIRDFLALARTRPNHFGLVLVNDQNTRERQTAAIARIVTAMLRGRTRRPPGASSPGAPRAVGSSTGHGRERYLRNRDRRIIPWHGRRRRGSGRRSCRPGRHRVRTGDCRL